MGTARDLMESWRPSEMEGDVTDGMLALAVAGDAVPRDLGLGLVNGETLTGETHVGILSARSAVPHVDDESPPWSALWILQAGAGHRLSMADHVPSNPNGIGRIPPTKPHFHTDLSAGDVVLFHAHRLHWLKPAADKGMLVAVSVDFDARPTRDEVEERLVELARSFDLIGGAPAP